MKTFDYYTLCSTSRVYKTICYVKADNKLSAAMKIMKAGLKKTGAGLKEIKEIPIFPPILK